VLERRTYRKGQTILRQGENGESLFVIISGQVRIYTLSLEGHQVSVSICDKGDFFGEMALPWPAPRAKAPIAHSATCATRASYKLTGFAF
jgi:CRP-like cAMP-binding protein